MTNNTFAEAPAETPGPNRKVLIIAGGAVGAAVLAGAGWMLLHGGSSANDTALVVPRHAPVVKPATAAKTLKSPVRTTKLPAASSVKIGRDPFAALYLVPAAAGPATGAGTTTGTSPSSTSTSSTSATSTTTSTAGNTRYAITLTKVTTDPGGAKLYTIKIGTTTKTVLTAQRFGKYGELVVLTYIKNSKGAVAGVVLQVGDDNPVTVAVGQKLSVQ